MARLSVIQGANCNAQACWGDWLSTWLEVSHRQDTGMLVNHSGGKGESAGWNDSTLQLRQPGGKQFVRQPHSDLVLSFVYFQVIRFEGTIKGWFIVCLSCLTRVLGKTMCKQTQWRLQWRPVKYPPWNLLGATCPSGEEATERVWRWWSKTLELAEMKYIHFRCSTQLSDERVTSSYIHKLVLLLLLSLFLQSVSFKTRMSRNSFLLISKRLDFFFLDIDQIQCKVIPPPPNQIWKFWLNQAKQKEVYDTILTIGI